MYHQVYCQLTVHAANQEEADESEEDEEDFSVQRMYNGALDLDDTEDVVRLRQEDQSDEITQLEIPFIKYRNQHQKIYFSQKILAWKIAFRRLIKSVESTLGWTVVSTKQ